MGCPYDLPICKFDSHQFNDKENRAKRCEEVAISLRIQLGPMNMNYGDGWMPDKAQKDEGWDVFNINYIISIRCQFLSQGPLIDNVLPIVRYEKNRFHDLREHKEGNYIDIPGKLLESMCMNQGHASSAQFRAPMLQVHAPGEAA